MSKLKQHDCVVRHFRAHCSIRHVAQKKLMEVTYIESRLSSSRSKRFGQKVGRNMQRKKAYMRSSF